MLTVTPRDQMTKCLADPWKQFASDAQRLLTEQLQAMRPRRGPVRRFQNGAIAVAVEVSVLGRDYNGGVWGCNGGFECVL